MIESKIRKVGNSAVVTLSAEMLALLDAKEGDTLSKSDGSRVPGPQPRLSWMKTATCFRHLHDPMGLDAAARIACHP